MTSYFSCFVRYGLFLPGSFLRRSLLVSSVCLGLAACNGSSNNNPPQDASPPSATPPDSTPPDSPEIEVDAQLPLDFLLPLTQAGVSAEQLTGVTLDPQREEFVFIAQPSEVIFLSQQGSITQQFAIPQSTDIRFTGIEYMQQGEYLLSTDDSRLMVLLIDEQALTLTPFGTVDFAISAVAYDANSAAAMVIDNTEPSAIVSVQSDGSITRTNLELSLHDYAIEGLTQFEDNLLIAAVEQNSSEAETLIVASDLQGDFGPVWEIETASTSGLALIDPQAPEFITPYSDAQLSVALYAAERPASVPTEAPLSLIEVVELCFDQPSGVDFSSSTGELFYITDFGEVRRRAMGADDEDDSELLFELDGMQGSFEAIAADTTNELLYLMLSDDASEQNSVLTMDYQGNQITETVIASVDSEHIFESLEVVSSTPDGSNTFYTVSAVEGSKVLYQITDSGTSTVTLPSDYDELIIAGMAVSPTTDTLYFVTEEWESEDVNGQADTLNAGLLVVFDLINQTEVGKYSIAIEEDGTQQGVRDPSGVAVDINESKVYVTSDIDDAVMYVFELP